MKTSILTQNKVPEQVVPLISRLVDLIPWPQRRQAMADVTLSLLKGKHRAAEEAFGWGRAVVELGMNELRTGLLCLNDISARKRPKAEEKEPELLADIREIMEPHCQSESHLRTALLYTNMTAKSVYDALLEKGWSEEALPTMRTIYNILERHGYRLRTVEKTKVKKTADTDAIFANVREVNMMADADPATLRISIDTKATVHVGEYSRRGQSRSLKSVKALDHDMYTKEKLVPGGILEPVTGKAFIFYTDSNKTSDFMVDGLLLWWNENKEKQHFSTVKNLVVNMDNGPECSGRRSQFLLRMAEFADLTQLTVRLTYYPPYHSKYNAIERYWAGLERSWNNYLLDTPIAVLNRTSNFIWKGFRATVNLMSSVYEKGVKLCGKEKAVLEQRLQRSSKLSLYDILIQPKTVN